MVAGTATTWQLRARSGRAVLVRGADREVEPERLRLPEPLVAALNEWAQVVDEIHAGPASDPGADSTAEQVSLRGRQLAKRLAAHTGVEIGYVDPLTGAVIGVGRRSAHAVTREHRGVVQPVAPVRPTPWGPGLTVSAIVAAIVSVTLVVVTLGLADVSVVLGVVVNLAVAAGFAPSIWLGRNLPVWRWVAYGTGGGVVLAWIALILSLLG
ncbi:DUF2537 domain-containing protein [Saccharopolyspora rosea]|uniref:DUF2537 domain-containing protein n=1 Tax=Saccharopolyspora rosea TaxID=524884 RepID=A0ABW3FQA9_9PSEU|nr:DUF2537 domain-containing protein [Saccharopolyspora rosea]